MIVTIQTNMSMAELNTSDKTPRLPLKYAARIFIIVIIKAAYSDCRATLIFFCAVDSLISVKIYFLIFYAFLTSDTLSSLIVCVKITPIIVTAAPIIKK